ncbi:hypothetical protein D623_10008896 [Myotis brandtii]|uniref:Uncharacterized protein n=1 Tax=Myotis brandtii TaxID=109478 RepID=S7PQA4_MYOBR|nr:hypothetical protein D623_10008896 [Myotis brandtii]
MVCIYPSDTLGKVTGLMQLKWGELAVSRVEVQGWGGEGTSPDKTEWSRIRAALYIGLALSSVKFGALQTYSSDYLLRTSPAISISAAG